MQQFRDDYAAMKTRLGDTAQSWSGYDRWVAQANNAAFGAQGAYDDLVDAFNALLQREHGDWRSFMTRCGNWANYPSRSATSSFWTFSMRRKNRPMAEA